MTAVETNPKGPRHSASHQSSPNIQYPAIAYFIVVRQTDTCNENKIFTLFHNEDTQVSIQAIATRAHKDASQVMENASRQLFQVVKDHNNVRVMNIVNASNLYCLRNSALSESEDVDEPVRPLYPTCPCRLVVVNCTEFDVPLNEAMTKLKSDGMTIEIESALTPQIDGACLSSTTEELSATIRKIAKVMEMSKHGLHRATVYAKPDEATATYVRMMDVESYLNKLLVNEALRPKILKHYTSLVRTLSHPACEIIKQLQFDVDLIEVSNGFFFRISTRSFVRNAIQADKIGTLSPRAFVPYDSTTAPRPGYFKEGIINSFPDDVERAKFCNKFYQCLMAFKMPHKGKKLVVAGPKDSRKTSWAMVFHRLIPPGRIASITKEKQFSAAMIDEDTQLVFVDEWSRTTLDTDLAKTILQGGWMVTAVKHGVPRTIMNNSPFYITTNEVSDFGDDDDNVKRRIAIFETTTLPTTIKGADKWIYENAMDCLVWLANEVSSLRTHIDADELWYEPTSGREEMTIPNNQGTKLFDVVAIARITNEDLDDANTPEVKPTNVVHESFTLHSTRQTLARKRRSRIVLLSSSSESEYADVPVNFHDVETYSESPDVISLHFPEAPAISVVPVPVKRSAGLNIKRRAIRRQRTTICEPLPSTSAHASQEPSQPDNMEHADSFCPSISEPSRWVLNDATYHQKIVELWEAYFHEKNLSRVHAASFISKLHKAERKRDKKERDFWTEPDPYTDAWMIVTGRLRTVFDMETFVNRHNNAIKYLQRVRRRVEVRVMQDRCPMLLALARIPDAEMDEGES